MKTPLCALMLAFAFILLPVSYAQASAPPSTGSTPPAATSGSTMRRPGPCHEDVQKFCGNVQKGGGRVLACLKQHEGQLSPKCEAGMKRHESSQSLAPAQSAPAQVPSSATQPSK